jgi:hypothetical protein
MYLHSSRGALVRKDLLSLATTESPNPWAGVLLPDQEHCRSSPCSPMSMMAMRQRREAVLEHHHVVVAGGDLGQPIRAGWTQRALGGGREVGAGLAVTGDHHPLVDQHVVADLRRRLGRGDVPAVELGERSAPGPSSK